MDAYGTRPIDFVKKHFPVPVSRLTCLAANVVCQNRLDYRRFYLPQTVQRFIEKHDMHKKILKAEGRDRRKEGRFEGSGRGGLGWDRGGEVGASVAQWVSVISQRQQQPLWNTNDSTI